jgi:hypothetical protein
MYVRADAYAPIANKFDLLCTGLPVVLAVVLEVPALSTRLFVSRATYPLEYIAALLTFRLFTIVTSTRNLLFGLLKVRGAPAPTP